VFFFVLFNVYIFLLQLKEANQKVSEALIKLKDVEGLGSFQKVLSAHIFVTVPRDVFFVL
jgi:hypothetical protein